MYNKQLEVAKIFPNPEQPRRHFDETTLQALADSIAERGLLQAILVEESGDGTYIIHDGERRWRAHQLLGRQSIAAAVRPALNGDGDRERLLNAFVANAQRADLSPMEEAQAFGRLRDMGMTVQEIVKATGVNMGTVDGRLLLSRLDEPLQALVEQGLLPIDPRVTRALLTVEDGEMRVKLGARLARPGITINAIMKACERLNEQLQQQAVRQEVKEPMIALATAGKTPKAETAVKWPNVRAAAAAMCEQCDVKASLRGVAEPAWGMVLTSAKAVCDSCSLRPAPGMNMDICAQCPGVDLLKRLVGSER